MSDPLIALAVFGAALAVAGLVHLVMRDRVLTLRRHA
jgi:hypothetical protein